MFPSSKGRTQTNSALVPSFLDNCGCKYFSYISGLLSPKTASWNVHHFICERYQDTSHIYEIQDVEKKYYREGLPSGSSFVQVTSESPRDSFLNSKKALFPLFESTASF